MVSALGIFWLCPAPTPHRISLRPHISELPGFGFPAEQSAGQGQKRLVYVCPFLIANSRAAKLTEPSERPLHDPTASTRRG